MADPLIDEFCRAHNLQPHFLRRCQREFRERIQPQLEERERLLVENAGLKVQLEALQAKAGRKRHEKDAEALV